ncbi:hypothetical protein J7K27_02685 [Candidatus Bathyarchaeota archaeon]|nr:hypothetical protein [Candidatus Bathyarchaeota archaeon]
MRLKLVVLLSLFFIIFVASISYEVKFTTEANSGGWTGTVYIRADGSIEPTTAPIQRIEDIYKLLKDVQGGIVIEASNIIFDGQGYRIEGNFTNFGIKLEHTSGVIVRNVMIKRCAIAVYITNCHNITVSHLKISDLKPADGFYMGHVDSNVEVLGIGIYVKDCSHLVINSNSLYCCIGGILGFGIYNSNFTGNSIHSSNTFYIDVSTHTGIPYPYGLRISCCSYCYFHKNSIGPFFTRPALIQGGSNDTFLENGFSTLDIHIFNSQFIRNTVNCLTIEGDYNKIFENKIGEIHVKGRKNKIFHNDISGHASSFPNNFWDDGYPSGGNYWEIIKNRDGIIQGKRYCDDKHGINQNEPGSDGIFDLPYLISGGAGIDRYPLAHPYHSPDMVIEAKTSMKLYTGQTSTHTLSFRSNTCYILPLSLDYKWVDSQPDEVTVSFENRSLRLYPYTLVKSKLVIDVSPNASLGIFHLVISASCELLTVCGINKTLTRSVEILLVIAKDLIPPKVLHLKAPKFVSAGRNVSIEVLARDDQSGIGSITLSYCLKNDKNWNNITCQDTNWSKLMSGEILNQIVERVGTIPEQMTGSIVLYKVYISDKAGNEVTLDKNGECYFFYVIDGYVKKSIPSTIKFSIFDKNLKKEYNLNLDTTVIQMIFDVQLTIEKEIKIVASSNETEPIDQKTAWLIIEPESSKTVVNANFTITVIIDNYVQSVNKIIHKTSDGHFGKGEIPFEEIVFSLFDVPHIGEMSVVLSPKIKFNELLTITIEHRGNASLNNHALQWNSSIGNILYIKFGKGNYTEVKLLNSTLTLIGFFLETSLGVRLQSFYGAKEYDLGSLSFSIDGKPIVMKNVQGNLTLYAFVKSNEQARNINWQNFYRMFIFIWIIFVFAIALTTFFYNRKKRKGYSS